MEESSPPPRSDDPQRRSEDEDERARKRLVGNAIAGVFVALIVGVLIGALAFSSDDDGDDSRVAALRKKLAETEQQLRKTERKLKAATAQAGSDGGETSAAAGPTTCPDIALAQDSDAIASKPKATGLSCEEAEALIVQSNGGPIAGYDCTDELIDPGDDLPHTQYVCSEGEKTIEWDRF